MKEGWPRCGTAKHKLTLPERGLRERKENYLHDVGIGGRNGGDQGKGGQGSGCLG